MIDVIAYLQTTLDEALLTDQRNPVYSYWLLRQDLTANANADEYIVYSVEEHDQEAGADGTGLIYTSYITLRYFCRDSWIGDTNKYSIIKDRMQCIRNALLDAGFDVSSGWQDIGDVDGISFEAFILTAEYTEVDYGYNESRKFYESH